MEPTRTRGYWQFAGVAASLAASAAVAVAVALVAGQLMGFAGASAVRVAVRAVAVLAVLAMGVAPRLAVSLGGLATADFLVRAGAALAPPDVAARYDSDRFRLAGAMSGLALVAGTGGVWLSIAGPPPDQSLAVLVGCCLVLRARLVSGSWTAVAVTVAGVGAFAAGVYGLAVAAPHSSTLLLAPATALALGWLYTVGGRPAQQRPGRRVLQWLEGTAVTGMVCAGVAAQGLPDAAQRLFG